MSLFLSFCHWKTDHTNIFSISKLFTSVSYNDETFFQFYHCQISRISRIQKLQKQIGPRNNFFGNGRTLFTFKSLYDIFLSFAMLLVLVPVVIVLEIYYEFNLFLFSKLLLVFLRHIISISCVFSFLIFFFFR